MAGTEKPGDVAMDSNQANNHRLGQDEDAVRVLNFAGGAFDTVMQLGAVHALLVIQGRPPDAVVGISAGAIQAAACAEILQAGEAFDCDPDSKENAADQADKGAKKRSVEELCASYRRRQEARVKALRHFIDAAERAPDEIFDAALPDAYEIESRDPLQPLRSARFAKEERDERERMLQVRSGLVKLYNDLLRIQLPIGVITRAVRRWLGFAAASDIPGFWSRQGVRVLEWFRIWLLLGAQLYHLSKMAPTLVRPLLTHRVKARVSTAGGLIFRFPILQEVLRTCLDFVSLYILSSSWVLISAIPGIILIELKGHIHASWYLVAFFGLPYLFPLLMALAQAVTKHDAVTHMDALKEGAKGFSKFFVSIFVWSIVTYLLSALFIHKIITGIPEIVYNNRNKQGWEAAAQIMVDFAIRPESFWAFMTGALILGVILGFAVVRYLLERSQEHKATGEKLGGWGWYARNFLRGYGLARSLLHHYPIESFLAKHFDRDYYAKLDMDHAIEESLRTPAIKPAKDRDPTRCHKGSMKTVGEYFTSSQRNPPIAIGLGVAEVGNTVGSVEIVPETVPIVCALRAATALVPLLPPVEVEGKLYVDATNVTSVPMPALLKLLRKHGIADNVKAVYAYRVAPVPFSSKTFEWQNQQETVVNLVDIALRAFRLQQYRDAGLEQRLTHRYSKQLASGEACPDGKKSFFRIWVVPVELDIPTGLNRRIQFSDRTQRREEILKTIAQGCRAAMQVMIPATVASCAKSRRNDPMKCHKVWYAHNERYTDPKVKAVASQRLPGSGMDTTEPPGLSEVCKHCSQTLELTETDVSIPNWPHECGMGSHRPMTDDKHPASPHQPDTQTRNQIIEAMGKYWPRSREAATDSGMSTHDREPVRRPTVSLLFSGGVFRGVFQIGVVNALHELGVKPDIVAGASVGSITAAIAAHILALKHTGKPNGEVENDSGLELARLAASYLAIDRIILTDRFADFVREFTLRAANTRFSLKKADQLFRKYDQPMTMNFDHGAREVVAGLERLFYINFYQLNALVKVIRQRNDKRAARLLKHFVQQWLNRMNVGEEMLGAEPLEAMINHFIGSDDAASSLISAGDKRILQGCFQQFLAKGVIFLATTTELHDGKLEILGDPFADYRWESPLDLAQSLLASSAFPSVFRARSTSEIFPYAHRIGQYIDGGVMDNLPIDAVVRLLEDTSDQGLKKRLISRRPSGIANANPVPHLIFAASLEPEVKAIEHPAHLHVIQSYWPRMGKRVKQLRYNHKLNVYGQAAEEINELYEYASRGRNSTQGSEVLNLNIAALKPNWLCGTFAFHPMLGYRREKQAESIAHGCAMTLLRLRGYDDEHLLAWGIQPDDLPVVKTLDDAVREMALPEKPNAGRCWLRTNTPCPFSEKSLEALNATVTGCGKKLDSYTIRQLAGIHIACCRPQTHRA